MDGCAEKGVACRWRGDLDGLVIVRDAGFVVGDVDGS